MKFFKTLLLMGLFVTGLMAQGQRPMYRVPNRMQYTEKTDAEITTIGTPSSGFGFLYNKNGVMYLKDDNGVEFSLGGGGSGSSYNVVQAPNYYLDGTSDYVEVADDADIDVGIHDFSLRIKFRPSNVTDANQFLINKEAGGIGYGLEMREDDLWIRIDDNTADSTAIIGTAVFLADVLYDVVVTFDRSGSATAYINGGQIGTKVISGVSATLSSAGVLRFGTESGGVTKEFTGDILFAAVDNVLYTAAEVSALNAPTLFKYDGASQAELMPNQVDRDFSGASAWTNVDINAYDETTDLTVTASVAAQYATLAVASAPTTVGKDYRMTYDLANIVDTWTVKSFDDAQTIGVISANATQGVLEWTATTTGGYRLVADSTTSSGDFDNFTLVQMGVVAEYNQAGITAATWYDASGNNNDGTVTGGSLLNKLAALDITDVLNVNGALVSDTYNFAADGEANDTYVITLSPAADSYQAGMMIVFTANTLNTDGATLNVNGLGAKNILKLRDQTLATGDIEAGQVIVVVYNGTSFEMISQLAQ